MAERHAPAAAPAAAHAPARDPAASDPARDRARTAFCFSQLVLEGARACQAQIAAARAQPPSAFNDALPDTDTTPDASGAETSAEIERATEHVRAAGERLAAETAVSAEALATRADEIAERQEARDALVLSDVTDDVEDDAEDDAEDARRELAAAKEALAERLDDLHALSAWTNAWTRVPCACDAFPGVGWNPLGPQLGPQLPFAHAVSALRVVLSGALPPGWIDTSLARIDWRGIIADKLLLRAFEPHTPAAAAALPFLRRVLCALCPRVLDINHAFLSLVGPHAGALGLHRKLQTILSQAAALGDTEAIRMLLALPPECSLSVNARFSVVEGGVERTALLVALQAFAKHPQNPSVLPCVEALLDHPDADVNVMFEGGPLIHALLQEAEAVQWLLLRRPAGLDVNARNSNETPFLTAIVIALSNAYCKQDDDGIAAFKRTLDLLVRGFPELDAAATDHPGYTALMHACRLTGWLSTNARVNGVLCDLLSSFAHFPERLDVCAHVDDSRCEAFFGHPGRFAGDAFCFALVNQVYTHKDGVGCTRNYAVEALASLDSSLGALGKRPFYFALQANDVGAMLALLRLPGLPWDNASDRDALATVASASSAPTFTSTSTFTTFTFSTWPAELVNAAQMRARALAV